MLCLGPCIYAHINKQPWLTVEYLNAFAWSLNVRIIEIVQHFFQNVQSSSWNHFCLHLSAPLRQVKNYLTSTMMQQCLNNLMVLHVHKERISDLSEVDIYKDLMQTQKLVEEFLANFCEFWVKQFSFILLQIIITSQQCMERMVIIKTNIFPFINNQIINTS